MRTKTLIGFAGTCSNKLMNSDEIYIEITDELHSKLICYRQDLNIAANRLYRYMHYCGLLPENTGLSVSRLESWYSRTAKTAQKRDLEAVLNALESIGDETGITPDTHPRQLIKLSDTLRQEIAAYLSQRTKLTLRRMLAHPECPQTLKFNMLNRFCRKEVCTTYAEIVVFIMAQMPHLQGRPTG